MIRQPSGRPGVLVLLMGSDSDPPRLNPVAKRDRGVGVLIRLIVRSPTVIVTCIYIAITEIAR